MVVSACKHECTKKFGKDKYGNQRLQCLLCGKTFIDRSNRPLGDLRIEHDRADHGPAQTSRRFVTGYYSAINWRLQRHDSGAAALDRRTLPAISAGDRLRTSKPMTFKLTSCGLLSAVRKNVASR